MAQSHMGNDGQSCFLFRQELRQKLKENKRTLESDGGNDCKTVGGRLEDWIGGPPMNFLYLTSESIRFSSFEEMTSGN